MILFDLNTCNLALSTECRRNQEGVPCEILAAGLEVSVENLFRRSVRNPPFAYVPSNCIYFDLAYMPMGDKSVRNYPFLGAMGASAGADIEAALTGAHGIS